MVTATNKRPELMKVGASAAFSTSWIVHVLSAVGVFEDTGFGRTPVSAGQLRPENRAGANGMSTSEVTPSRISVVSSAADTAASVTPSIPWPVFR
jgi:hypothetical protein